MSIKLLNHKYKAGDEMFYTRPLIWSDNDFWIEKSKVKKIGYRFFNESESVELLYFFKNEDERREDEIFDSKQKLLEMIKKRGEEISKRKICKDD